MVDIVKIGLYATIAFCIGCLIYIAATMINDKMFSGVLILGAIALVAMILKDPYVGINKA
jgi:hypothetical protein